MRKNLENRSYLTFPKIFGIILLETRERRKFLMELELLRALILIANTCFLQNSYEDCPMRELCGKMPCEW